MHLIRTTGASWSGVLPDSFFAFTETCMQRVQPSHMTAKRSWPVGVAASHLQADLPQKPARSKFVKWGPWVPVPRWPGLWALRSCFSSRAGS